MSVLSLGYEDPEIRDYTLLMFVLIVHAMQGKTSNDFSVWTILMDGIEEEGVKIRRPEVRSAV